MSKDKRSLIEIMPVGAFVEIGGRGLPTGVSVGDTSKEQGDKATTNKAERSGRGGEAVDFKWPPPEVT